MQCGGRKPSCSSCLKAGIFCHYSERALIEGQNARDALTLQRLRSLPSAEAGRLLENIRTNDVEKSSTMCPSLAGVLWSYLSPSRNKFEFELIVRYPIAYPLLIPLEITSLPLESLLRPSRILITRQGPSRLVIRFPS